MELLSRGHQTLREASEGAQTRSRTTSAETWLSSLASRFLLSAHLCIFGTCHLSPIYYWDFQSNFFYRTLKQTGHQTERTSKEKKSQEARRLVLESVSTITTWQLWLWNFLVFQKNLPWVLLLESLIHHTRPRVLSNVYF